MAAGVAKVNASVARAKIPRPHARSSLVFGAVTISTRMASSRRGLTTGGSSATDDGANASGVGGTKAIAEVATVGTAASVGGGEPSSESGFVRWSASCGNESLAMAVQPLLRRRIIRTMNRRTRTGTPTAIPARLTAVNDQVGPAGADGARTSTTHWKSAEADPSDTTTFTTNVPVSLRPNS